ncbi:MAG: HlyD family efflux transporter periplasmic adaptor subunit, partial [Bryobacterales bacterium]|nr:HlyD family efflux transporter periplasmic adaptor subunit [Bryobacterales bacterium]
MLPGSGGERARYFPSQMDIQRKGAARSRLIRRIVYSSISLIALTIAGIGVARLKPAPASVERGTLWFGTVKRGPMIRNVRGMGTLVPEDILLIPAGTDGRVEKIILRPGAQVKSDTVILELSNPQLENDALDALYQLKSAEAGLIQLRVTLESTKLQQQAATAQVQSDFTQARIQAERDEELSKEGLGAEIVAKLSRAKSDELSNRTKIEEKRLSISDDSIKAQMDGQQVQIDKLTALYGLRKTQVDQLKVRAGADGILQQMAVEVGQRVPAGTVLAKVAEPRKLKAELKIAETQAKDVMPGQAAEIDTRNGVIPGRVSRIDPASVNGTVTVDVRLTGELPQGARPDLSVDGTVELERLNDVLYME